MFKSIAIPMKFYDSNQKLRTDLTADEEIELAQYGMQPMNPVEISARTAEEAAWAAEQAEKRPGQLKAYLANLRWEFEVAGALWNGFPVASDRDSQSKLMAESLRIMLGQRSEPASWKFLDGVFREVSNTDFPALAAAVAEHVAEAFATEEAVLARIESGELTTEDEINTAFLGES